MGSPDQNLQVIPTPLPPTHADELHAYGEAWEERQVGEVLQVVGTSSHFLAGYQLALPLAPRGRSPLLACGPLWLSQNQQ